MDKENVMHVHKGILGSCKEKRNHDICGKTGGARNHCVKQNKANSERQVPHPCFHAWRLDASVGVCEARKRAVREGKERGMRRM